MENIVVVKCNAELLRSLGMKTWRIAPTWCALLYWPKMYVALKDTGQNLNKRHIRLVQKLKFSGIPDTRNTRWFWKKIGSGSGIDKNFGFGSGIGYPLGPDCWHNIPFVAHLQFWKPFWKKTDLIRQRIWWTDYFCTRKKCKTCCVQIPDVRNALSFRDMLGWDIS